MDAGNFRIGSHGWILAKKFKLAPDFRNRLTVTFSGTTFTLGPIAKCSSSPDPYYDFIRDRDDQIAFVKSHSWLSWPTPFAFSIMGASTTFWRRHSYLRLL